MPPAAGPMLSSATTCRSRRRASASAGRQQGAALLRAGSLRRRRRHPHLEARFHRQALHRAPLASTRHGLRLPRFAKALYPHGIELHCAQQNFGACRLYERHGFIAVTHEIYQPIGIGDVIYRWPGN